MKRLLSAMTVTLLMLSFSPLAQAAFTDEQDQLIRTQREIRQQLKGAHGSRLSELKLELRSLQRNLRDLRLRERQERRQLRIKPVTVAIEPVIISAEETAPKVELGKASYYADKFNGRSTASGEVFSNTGMTAAHKTLPFGTKVRVTNPANGNMVEVTINDRGPSTPGRIIDLTSTAFSALDNLSRGVIDVQVEVIE